MLRLSGLRCAPAPAGPPAQLRHDGDAHADRATSIPGPACSRNSSIGICSRCWSWCATRSGATTPSASPAPRNSTRTRAIPAMPIARTISARRCSPSASQPQRGWPCINLFYNTGIGAAERHLPRRSLVAARRLRAVPGHDRSRLRLDGLSRRYRCHQCLEPDGYPCPRLSGPQQFFTSDRLPHDTRFRSQADPRDSLPSAHLGADPQLHRISRLLAADQVQQPRRRRRVSRLPRGGGRDRPLALAQVRGAGARCRDADAAHLHPQHAPAGGRAGGLYGALLRERRHARRCGGLPHGRRPLSPRSAATNTPANGCATRRRPAVSRPGSNPRPTSSAISRCRGPRAATC